MSRDSFPLYPSKGDYIKFKSDFEHEQEDGKKVKVIIKDDIAVVLTTKIESDPSKKHYTLYMEIGLKNGKVFPFNFGKFIDQIEVIPVNSPAFKVLYGS